jgi:hypothetical protein
MNIGSAVPHQIEAKYFTASRRDLATTLSIRLEISARCL